MTTVYFVIPVAEFTQEMLSASTSRDESEFPVKTIDSQAFYLIEAEESLARTTTAFAPYKRFYTAKAVDYAIVNGLIKAQAQKIDIRGIIYRVVPRGQTDAQDYATPANRFIDRVHFEAQNPKFGDRLTIEVLAGPQLLMTPVAGFYVSQHPVDLALSKTMAPAGLTVRLKYTSTATGLEPQAAYILNFFQREA